MVEGFFTEIKSLIPKEYIKRSSPKRASLSLTNGSKIFIKYTGRE